jgi:GMP synthase-like glutamine amidotransferase
MSPPTHFVYYTHSFHAPVGAATAASTEYGEPFSAAIERDNIFGVQFHPEKVVDDVALPFSNFVRPGCDCSLRLIVLKKCSPSALSPVSMWIMAAS